MALTWLSRSASCLLLLVVLSLVSSSTASSRVLLGDIGYSMAERHEQWMAQFGRVNNFTKMLTNEEFTAARNGYKGLCLEAKVSSFFNYENVSAVPSTMDCRKKGVVTPIKDQGQCGCCWAFSAVAATEGIHKLKTGKLVSLSEQELVDCDTKGADQGCEGGLMDDAFHFIMSNKGLNTEINYLYKRVDGTCNAKKASTHAAQLTGFEDVPANSEAAQLKAVANQPVSVAIDASGSDFQFYSSGVFTHMV